MAKENLVLIGFMGSGKTVIGRQVARLLKYDFADTDEEIQSVTGMTLAELYRKHGPIRFHSEEELVVRKLAGRHKLVIASGGSLMPQKEPLAMLAENSLMVLLKADPDIIIERISRKVSRGKRPLLQGKPEPAYIKELLAEREQQYLDLADTCINTSTISVEEAAGEIVKFYKQHVLT